MAAVESGRRDSNPRHPAWEASAETAGDTTVAPEEVYVKDFDQVYREHQPQVLRYLKSQLRDKNLAYDLCQEVFIVAFKQQKPVLNWRNFLSRTARNRVMRYRKGEFRIRAESLPKSFDPAETTRTETNCELAERLASGLARLTDNESRLYRMYYVDGQTSTAIASLLSIRTNTVTKSLSEIRKKLSMSRP